MVKAICVGVCEKQKHTPCSNICNTSSFNCCFECIYRYDHRMPCGLKMYESKKDKYFKYLLLRAKLKKQGWVFSEK